MIQTYNSTDRFEFLWWGKTNWDLETSYEDWPSRTNCCQSHQSKMMKQQKTNKSLNHLMSNIENVVKRIRQFKIGYVSSFQIKILYRHNYFDTSHGSENEKERAFQYGRQNLEVVSLSTSHRQFRCILACWKRGGLWRGEWPREILPPPVGGMQPPGPSLTPSLSETPQPQSCLLPKS